MIQQDCILYDNIVLIRAASVKFSRQAREEKNIDTNLTEKIKQVAKDAGADLVGVGSMDRFEGAPKQFDPRYIFPEATAIIGLGFRIARGYLRGTEEGTHFYQYPTLGYANINEVYAPVVLRRLACFVEDQGYEAVALRNFGGRGPVSDMTGSADEPAEFGRRVQYSRPVRPGLPAPDVFLHFRIAAFVCGMGEIGFSKLFLTPQFGPRQRFAFMLTDAPLKPDPLYEGPPLCDRCMQCVAECPGALSKTETVKVTIAGRQIEWAKLDEWYCFFAYASGLKSMNPFLPPDAFSDMPNGEKILNGEISPTSAEVVQIHKRIAKYYTTPSGYNAAMCGGRGCIRACMIHLEQQGKLQNKFHDKFRKRRPWWRVKAKAEASPDSPSGESTDNPNQAES